MYNVPVACFMLGFRVAGETVLDIISEWVLWIWVIVFMGNFGIDWCGVHGVCNWSMSVSQWLMSVHGGLSDDASTGGSDESAECKELESIQIKSNQIINIRSNRKQTKTKSIFFAKSKWYDNWISSTEEQIRKSAEAFRYTISTFFLQILFCFSLFFIPRVKSKH